MCVPTLECTNTGNEVLEGSQLILVMGFNTDFFFYFLCISVIKVVNT